MIIISGQYHLLMSTGLLTSFSVRFVTGPTFTHDFTKNDTFLKRKKVAHVHIVRNRKQFLYRKEHNHTFKRATIKCFYTMTVANRF